MDIFLSEKIITKSLYTSCRTINSTKQRLVLRLFITTAVCFFYYFFVNPRQMPLRVDPSPHNFNSLFCAEVILVIHA